MLLLIGAFSAGCGTETFDSQGAPIIDDFDSSLIIGELDWVEVTTLEPTSVERQRSRAIGNISIPARGTRCTGFLISRNVVMTNAHCVPNAESAVGLTVAFDREHGVPAENWAVYGCSEWIGKDTDLDFALLRCRGNPGDTHGFLQLSTHEADVGDEMYVVHQNCDFYTTPGCPPDKKLSPGKVSAVGGYIKYNADTALGSSGAPAISAADEHRVIALHHAGYGDDGNGRGAYTEGIAMTRIVPVLTERFADALREHSPDAVEPNDTAMDATDVSNGVDLTNLTVTEDDRDVFRVVVTQAATLRIDLRFVHANGDLDVDLFGANPADGAIASGTTTTDDESIIRPLSPGTYHFIVYGYEGATNAYQLGVRLESAPAPPSADLNEPNDEAARATAIAIGADDHGRIDSPTDTDVFVVDHPGGSRTIALTFDHGAGDLDLYIVDETGTDIGGSTGVDDIELVEGNFEAGRIYVRVVGYDGATGAYALSVR